MTAIGNGAIAAERDRPMRLRVDYADKTLSWVWEWGNTTEDIAERSRATCRRADC